MNSPLRRMPLVLTRAGLMRAGLMRAELMRAGLMRAGLMRAGLMRAGLMRAGLMRAGLMRAGLMRAGLMVAGLTMAGGMRSAVAADDRNSSCQVVATESDTGKTVDAISNSLNAMGAITAAIVILNGKRELPEVVTLAPAALTAIGSTMVVEPIKRWLKGSDPSTKFCICPDAVGASHRVTVSECGAAAGPSKPLSKWDLKGGTNNQDDVLGRARRLGLLDPDPKLPSSPLGTFMKPIDMKPIDLKSIDMKPIDMKPTELKPIDWRKVLDTTTPVWGTAQVQPGAQISGQVYERTGAIIPDARVELTNAPGAVRFSTYTDGSGHFSFRAAAGDYRLTIQKRGYAGKSVPLQTSGNGSVEKEVILTKQDEYPCDFVLYNQTEWTLWVATETERGRTTSSMVDPGHYLFLRNQEMGATIEASALGNVKWSVPVICHDITWANLVAR